LILENKNKFAARGEIFIKKNEFDTFNEKYAEGKYSNPRNLASGSIRRLKSSETALFPLNIFIYEGFFENSDIHKHSEILVELKRNGFPLNDHLGFFSEKEIALEHSFENFITGKIDDIPQYIDDITKQRNELDYEIDGLVIKINSLEDREKLGFTQHHPRWAIAYKFEAPMAETIVESIEVQIGRGGRATPVANLKPVSLAGSVISRATLHNQDYIDSICVDVGDRVTISKRGDVIPAVEEVLEKTKSITAYVIPDNCPVCDAKFIKDGAHMFCPNEECRGRLLGTLQYFVSRGQMDIETFGDKTIEFMFDKGFLKYIPDIYEFDYDKLLDFEGFKEKKIKNIKDAIIKSKENDFKILLSSLGLKDLGRKACELIIDKFKNIDEIIKTASKKNIEDFSAIDGIGEGIAKSIINHFNNPLILKMIEKLKKKGLKFEYEDINEIDESEKFLKNTKWVITGSFQNYKPRDKAGDIIKKYGGEVLGSVSSKTTHLLCGESPGSKLDKAEKLGVKIVDETEFIEMVEGE
jgi:DNA ligase (NAD+)